MGPQGLYVASLCSLLPSAPHCKPAFSAYSQPHNLGWQVALPCLMPTPTPMMSFLAAHLLTTIQLVLRVQIPNSQERGL